MTTRVPGMVVLTEVLEWDGRVRAVFDRRNTEKVEVRGNKIHLDEDLDDSARCDTPDRLLTGLSVICCTSGTIKAHTDTQTHLDAYVCFVNIHIGKHVGTITHTCICDQTSFQACIHPKRLYTHTHTNTLLVGSGCLQTWMHPVHGSWISQTVHQIF